MSLLFIPERLPLWVDAQLSSSEPPWLLPGFVPREGLTVIVGRPKLAKKSFLMGLIMMSIGSGLELGPFKPEGAHPVWIISREGTGPMVAKRFHVMSKCYDVDMHTFLMNSWMHQNGSFFLDDPKYIRDAVSFITLNGIKCVAIDTYAKSFQGDENGTRDTGVALRGIDKMREAGASVILVAHATNKRTMPSLGGYPDPDMGIRGSSAMAAAYDQIINIQELVVNKTFGTWAIVGGKYMDFVAYEQHWDIRHDGTEEKNLVYAKLETFDGPQERPYIGGGHE